MKLILSTLVFFGITLGYPDIYKNIIEHPTPNVHIKCDISQVQNQTWKLYEINTENLPNTQEFFEIKSQIENPPSCSLDDYITFDLKNHCVEYIRNEKCVPEEGNIETFNLTVIDQELILEDDDVSLSLFVKEANQNKLVLTVPIGYEDYTYDIIYLPKKGFETQSIHP